MAYRDVPEYLPGYAEATMHSSDYNAIAAMIDSQDVDGLLAFSNGNLTTLYTFEDGAVLPPGPLNGMGLLHLALQRTQVLGSPPVDVINGLIAAGANVDMPTANTEFLPKARPLTIAMSSGTIKASLVAANILLNAGADATAVDFYGDTPIDHAVESYLFAGDTAHFEMVKILAESAHEALGQRLIGRLGRTMSGGYVDQQTMTDKARRKLVALFSRPCRS